MRELVLTSKFRRAYRRLAKRDRALQRRIDDVLSQMQADVFSPALGTHKLGGALAGLWACSCGYDCRLVFACRSMKRVGIKSSCCSTSARTMKCTDLSLRRTVGLEVGMHMPARLTGRCMEVM